MTLCPSPVARGAEAFRALAKAKAKKKQAEAEEAKAAEQTQVEVAGSSGRGTGAGEVHVYPGRARRASSRCGHGQRVVEGGADRVVAAAADDL